jgi:hypothetical protein
MQLKDANALTPKEIAELKKDFGRIFKTTVCDRAYICRLLYKPDWDGITKMRQDNPKMTLNEIDEKIVNTCLIGPLPLIEDGGWSAEPAGVIPTLSMMVRAKSGFVVPDADVSMIDVEDIGEKEELKKPTESDMFVIKTSSKFQVKGVTIGNDYLVVRPLARVELRQVIQQPQTEQDVATADKAVVWPKGVNWEEKPAGYCETLTEVVMAISGFSGPSAVEDL